MWKIFTRIISTAIYDYIESNDRLPTEQKGCRRKSRGTKDQLLIDKTVMNDCRKRHPNLGMAWVDYKKAYDMINSGSILKSCIKPNHLLLMGNLKLFAKDEREINGLLSTVQLFSSDIRMEFGIQNCEGLVMKREKWH